MSRAYELLINAPKNLVNGEAFNAGWENKSVNDIALMVKNCLGSNIELVVLKLMIIDHTIYLKKLKKF